MPAVFCMAYMNELSRHTDKTWHFNDAAAYMLLDRSKHLILGTYVSNDAKLLENETM
jgi:hypothetical protein